MKRIYQCLITLLGLLLLSGCLAKGCYESVPGIVKIYFTYEATRSGVAINPSDIDDMNLFVFNYNTGLLVSMEKYDNPTMSPNYYITINDIPKGEYHFIAWGGLDDNCSINPNTLTINETTYHDMLLIFKHEEEVAQSIAKLLYAGTNRAKIKNKLEQNVYIPLIENTNKNTTIHLTTSSITNNSDRSDELHIYDNNDGNYNFDNSFASNSEFKYKGSCSKYYNAQLLTDLRVLKLDNGRDIDYYLENEYMIHTSNSNWI